MIGYTKLRPAGSIGSTLRVTFRDSRCVRGHLDIGEMCGTLWACSWILTAAMRRGVPVAFATEHRHVMARAPWLAGRLKGCSARSS